MNRKIQTVLSTLLLSAALTYSFVYLAQPVTATAESAPATGAVGNFAPTKSQRDTTREILGMLGKRHYLSIPINDAFSEKLLDSYLELLDPGKSHLFASDVRDFNRQRHELDDDIKDGDLKAMFDIYNVYHQRRQQRLKYMLGLLETGVDSINFDKPEMLELERKHAPWLKSRAAAEDLWRRLLKNDLLNLLLSDETRDSAIEKLKKRYTNQLRNLEQTNGDDVFELVMSAVTHIYDPHTDYFPPQESENFEIHMRLSFEGIGAHLQGEDEYTKVVKLITAGPADRGGLLQPADRIIGVAQGESGEMVDVTGWRLDDVVKLIRGKKGTLVRLKVIPADSVDITKTKIIPIVRDTVKLEEEAAKKRVVEVNGGDRPYKIGVIELRTFYIDFEAAYAGKPNYRSSTRDVEKLIRELQQDEKIDALVIDLRNNGGGSLQEANDLTGLFIPMGPVVQIRYAGGRVEPYSDVNPKLAYDGPLAVMVNRLSASASEIFAGAIQDYNRGIIIGNQTFGKGTVQTINQMNPGQLKYTQAKYYRISGDSTQERGVIPDIAYPSLIDNDEIGESALPEAMSWDQIEPARYRKLADLNELITELNKMHGERAKTDPDFKYFEERSAFLQQNRAKTEVSLKESERRVERKQSEDSLLSMENRRRQAKKLAPLKDYAELEATQEREDSDKPSDSMLEETGNILVDWIHLQQKAIASYH